MKNSITYHFFILLSLLVTTRAGYAQSNLSVTKAESALIKAQGINPQKMVRDTAGNFFLLVEGTKKLKARHYFEIFDQDLKHKKSVEPDLPKGEYIRAIATLGEKVIIVSSQDIDELNSGTIGYGIPDKNVYLQTMDAGGNLTERTTISLFEENKQTGASLEIIFSADKTKLLLFTASKKSKKKAPNVTPWVFDTETLELLWQKNTTCSRTDYYPEDAMVTNAGNVIVRYEGKSIYLISEAEARPKRIPLKIGGGKVLSSAKTQELPSGKLVLAGTIGPKRNVTQGYFIGTINETTGEVSEVKTKQFSQEIFDFYGLKEKKVTAGRGIYKMGLAALSEASNGSWYCDFEREDYTSLNGSHTIFTSPLIMKISASGDLENHWILPTDFQDSAFPKGGGHAFWMKDNIPYVLMNNSVENLSTDILTEKKAAKFVFAESTRPAGRKNRFESLVIRLNDDGAKSFQPIYSVKQDKLYAVPKFHVITKEGMVSAVSYEDSFQLFQLKF